MELRDKIIKLSKFTLSLRRESAKNTYMHSIIAYIAQRFSDRSLLQLYCIVGLPTDCVAMCQNFGKTARLLQAVATDGQSVRKSCKVTGVRNINEVSFHRFFFSSPWA